MTDYSLKDAIRWDGTRDPPVLQVLLIRVVETDQTYWWGGRKFRYEEEWVDVLKVETSDERG